MKYSLLLVVSVMLGIGRVLAAVDSLHIEQEGGQYFVLHRVEQGETLYALSKRYNSTVDQIRQSNAGLTGGLSLGAVVRIPVAASAVVPSSSATVQNTMVEPGIHDVKQGETLFSLAKRYGLSVDQIKMWNGISGNELTIGQKLSLRATSRETSLPTNTVPQKDPAATQGTPSAKNVSARIAKDSLPKSEPGKSKELATHKLEETTANVAEKETLPSLQGIEVAKAKGTRQTDMTVLIDPAHDEGLEPYSPVSKENMTQKKKADFKRVNESGLAEIITEQGDTQKYLALHRTAPVGTIIQVENEMNNVVVFVRVIGKLPDTGANDKLLIKLTKKAAQALGAIDKRFPVQLSYIP